MTDDDTKRDVLEVDVLLVGAGPASLAAAYRLARLAKETGKEISIAAIEKGPDIGALGFSGAVMDPRGLAALIPDYEARGAPLGEAVTSDEVRFLTKTKARKLPIVPAPMHNEGNQIVSLAQLIRWMGKQCEAEGVDLFPGFAGVEILYDGDRVAGVRTGDKGIDRHGTRKGTFEPGIDIRAKVTLFGEGPLGTLTERLVKKRKLADGANPQLYATGVKEVWEVPENAFGAGRVVHTLGHPLSGKRGIGGGFLYGHDATHLVVGYVVWLDYVDPHLHLQETFNRFKMHPWIRSLIENGEMIEYGAKAVPVGGWWSLPTMATDGGLILGDSAGLVDSQQFKGIHMAIQSGIFAAEAAFEGLESGDVSSAKLRAYDKAVRESWIGKELWKIRNFHQGFEKGFLRGAIRSELVRLLGGDWRKRLSTVRDPDRMRPIAVFHGEDTPPPEPLRPDGKLTFSRVDSVHKSGTLHEEDQPPHLHVIENDVCVERCTAEFGNPCTRFCPAAVYEVAPEGADRRIQVNFANCVHCKTCEIKDPYGNIEWVPPEGGGGPNYKWC